jgi:hypothetical protein
MDKFELEALEFHLPMTFKGLRKQYLLDCIFNDTIQKNWKPTTGDIIVGCTGNIFVISGTRNLNENIGGKMYFFGGSMCSRDSNSSVMDSTYCYTANESGIYYHPIKGAQSNCYHSSIRKFRYVPYPHELK